MGPFNPGLADMDPDFSLVVGILIGAVFSLLSFVFAFLANRSSGKVTLSGKVADYRQAWINQLRNDLAQFHAMGTTPDFKPHTEVDFYATGTRIQLMLNPRDEAYDELCQLMNNYLDAANGTKEEKYALDEKFVAVAQGILKREWERLKLDIKAQNV